MKKEQTKNQQEKNQKKSQKLQWHPAFCSALRLELLEDAENLEFTDEFQLTEKPLQIDCTVVKVKRDCKIKKKNKRSYSGIRHSVQPCAWNCWRMQKIWNLPMSSSLRRNPCRLTVRL